MSSTLEKPAAWTNASNCPIESASCFISFEFVKFAFKGMISISLVFESILLSVQSDLYFHGNGHTHSSHPLLAG